MNQVQIENGVQPYTPEEYADHIAIETQTPEPADQSEAETQTPEPTDQTGVGTEVQLP